MVGGVIFKFTEFNEENLEKSQLRCKVCKQIVSVKKIKNHLMSRTHILCSPKNIE